MGYSAFNQSNEFPMHSKTMFINQYHLIDDAPSDQYKWSNSGDDSSSAVESPHSSFHIDFNTTNNISPVFWANRKNQLSNPLMVSNLEDVQDKINHYEEKIPITDINLNNLPSKDSTIINEEQPFGCSQKIFFQEQSNFLSHEPTFMFDGVDFIDLHEPLDTCLSDSYGECNANSNSKFILPSPLVLMTPNLLSPLPKYSERSVTSRSPETRSRVPLSSPSARHSNGLTSLKRKVVSSSSSSVSAARSPIDVTFHPPRNYQKSPESSPLARTSTRSRTNPIPSSVRLQHRSHDIAVSRSENGLVRRRSVDAASSYKPLLQKPHSNDSKIKTNHVKHLQTDELRSEITQFENSSQSPMHRQRSTFLPSLSEQQYKAKKSSVSHHLYESSHTAQNSLLHNISQPLSRTPRQNLQSSSRSRLTTQTATVNDRYQFGRQSHPSSESGVPTSKRPQVLKQRVTLQSTCKVPLSPLESSLFSGFQPLSGFPPYQEYTEELIKRRAKFRESLDAIVMSFNRSGIQAALELLRQHHLIDPENPASIASFLFFVPGLDKREIGRFLGHHSPFSNAVLRRFVHLFQFSGVQLMAAIRLLFSKFQPPGESQQLFRIINEFSIAFAADNPSPGVTAEQICFLSYAVLMLHTDRHNARVRRKMSREEFVKLVPSSQLKSQHPQQEVGSSDTSDSTTIQPGLFDRKVLEAIYDDVSSSEFRLLLSDTDLVYCRLSKLPHSKSQNGGTSLTPPCTNPTSWGNELQSTPSDRNTFDASPDAANGPSDFEKVDALPIQSKISILDVSKPLVDRNDVDDLLKSGATFLKYCRNGTIKFRFVFLSEDGLSLCWGPVGSGIISSSRNGCSKNERSRRTMRMEDVLDVTMGSSMSSTFKRFRIPSNVEPRCCSVHTPHRTLDLCAPLELSPTLEVWAAALLVRAQLVRRARQRSVIHAVVSSTKMKRRFLQPEQDSNEAKARNYERINKGAALSTQECHKTVHQRSRSLSIPRNFKMSSAMLLIPLSSMCPAEIGSSTASLKLKEENLSLGTLVNPSRPTHCQSMAARTMVEPDASPLVDAINSRPKKSKFRLFRHRDRQSATVSYQPLEQKSGKSISLAPQENTYMENNDRTATNAECRGPTTRRTSEGQSQRINSWEQRKKGTYQRSCSCSCFRSRSFATRPSFHRRASAEFPQYIGFSYQPNNREHQHILRTSNRQSLEPRGRLWNDRQRDSALQKLLNENDPISPCDPQSAVSASPNQMVFEHPRSYSEGRLQTHCKIHTPPSPATMPQLEQSSLQRARTRNLKTASLEDVRSEVPSTAPSVTSTRPGSVTSSLSPYRHGCCIGRTRKRERNESRKETRQEIDDLWRSDILPQWTLHWNNDLAQQISQFGSRASDDWLTPQIPKFISSMAVAPLTYLLVDASDLQQRVDESKQSLNNSEKQSNFGTPSFGALRITPLGLASLSETPTIQPRAEQPNKTSLKRELPNAYLTEDVKNSIKIHQAHASIGYQGNKDVSLRDKRANDNEVPETQDLESTVASSLPSSKTRVSPDVQLDNYSATSPSLNSGITSNSSSFWYHLSARPLSSHSSISALNNTSQAGICKPSLSISSSSAAVSTGLPHSFASRLDSIRSIWSRDPDGFLHLMSGTIRIPCSLQQAPIDPTHSSTNEIPRVAGITSMSFGTAVTSTTLLAQQPPQQPQYPENSLSDYGASGGRGPSPTCFWNSEYLQPPYNSFTNGNHSRPLKQYSLSSIQPVRWKVSMNLPCPYTALPAPYPPLPLSPYDLSFHKALQNKSLQLLSLWWVGLPPTLRPLLWSFALADRVESRQFPFLQQILDSYNITNTGAVEHCFSKKCFNSQGEVQLVINLMKQERYPLFEGFCGWITRLKLDRSTNRTVLPSWYKNSYKTKMPVAFPGSWNSIFGPLESLYIPPIELQKKGKYKCLHCQSSLKRTQGESPPHITKTSEELRNEFYRIQLSPSSNRNNSTRNTLLDLPNSMNTQLPKAIAKEATEQSITSIIAQHGAGTSNELFLNLNNVCSLLHSTGTVGSTATGGSTVGTPRSCELGTTRSNEDQRLSLLFQVAEQEIGTSDYRILSRDQSEKSVREITFQNRDKLRRNSAPAVGQQFLLNTDCETVVSTTEPEEVGTLKYCTNQSNSRPSTSSMSLSSLSNEFLQINNKFHSPRLSHFVKNTPKEVPPLSVLQLENFPNSRHPTFSGSFIPNVSASKLVATTTSKQAATATTSKSAITSTSKQTTTASNSYNIESLPTLRLPSSHMSIPSSLPQSCDSVTFASPPTGSPSLAAKAKNETPVISKTKSTIESCSSKTKRVICSTGILCTALRNEFGADFPLNCSSCQVVAFTLTHFEDLTLAGNFLRNLLSSSNHIIGDFLMEDNPRRRRRVLARLQLFQSLLSFKLPILFQHFKALELTPDFYFNRWMATLFVGIVPMRTLGCIWDRICLGGEIFAIQTALGLLRYYELKFLTSSFEGCMKILSWNFLGMPKDEEGHLKCPSSSPKTEDVEQNPKFSWPGIQENHWVEELLLNDFEEDRFWRCVDSCYIDPKFYRLWVDSENDLQTAADLMAMLNK